MRALPGSRLMNEGAIARWLEQKRRSDWAWASVICVLAPGCGVAVFLLTNAVIYTLVDIVSGIADGTVPPAVARNARAEGAGCT